MPTTRARLLAATTALLTLTTTTPATAQPPTQQPRYPGHTTSRYITAHNTPADTARAADAGCAAATTAQPGLRILFLGTQEHGSRLRHPGTTRTTTTPRIPTRAAVDIAAAYATGFTRCNTTDTTAHLALGVNNKDDGGIAPARAGRNWARIVEAAARRADTDHLTITGAIDAEPSWSTPAWARTWVDAYTATTDRRLYAANSAGGCPTPGHTSTACNNGWKLADIHYLATGAAPTLHAIPQIYRTDGIQARQWAAVSAWGAHHKNQPVRFAGALSQHTACTQRGGCTRTDNTPEAAWRQLRDALNARAATAVTRLPYATDMRWPAT
ncbi:hypothetical protein [Streptomonospora litoralis]|uniref:Uncharacterized protein n=1 Tax=Streptomonospora litoralis TaxID=2498135 RepID=A0A4P6Q2M4_9ACTN|nr:hypothetical protein [Streptomonospora litoralis]QBI54410.1 hypothetical protein EKD16_13140 [Streptomonospora litoralis]